MANYFNTLNLRQQLAQLGKCRFMARDEFADGASYLQGKKVVIVGCGAQGLNQGLNMRDSGLDISYALRKEAIAEKRASWRKATENGFKVGTYEELIPQADLVVNLTPDKQHSDVVRYVQPLMKDGAALPRCWPRLRPWRRKTHPGVSSALWPAPKTCPMAAPCAPATWCVLPTATRLKFKTPMRKAALPCAMLWSKHRKTGFPLRWWI